MLLHQLPADVRTVRRLVPPALAREAAVGVAHRTLVVALKGVEVLVVARLLRVPLVIHFLLRFEAPDVVVSTDVVHNRGDGPCCPALDILRKHFGKLRGGGRGARPAQSHARAGCERNPAGAKAFSPYASSRKAWKSIVTETPLQPSNLSQN